MHSYRFVPFAQIHIQITFGVNLIAQITILFECGRERQTSHNKIVEFLLKTFD